MSVPPPLNAELPYSELTSTSPCFVHCSIITASSVRSCYISAISSEPFGHNEIIKLQDKPSKSVCLYGGLW